MIEHFKIPNQHDLNAMREDTLARLEWSKITHYLAHFATFQHTKEILTALSPWENRNYNAFFYKKATKELLYLIESGIKFNFQPFDYSTFKQSVLQKSNISPGGLYQISIVLKLCQQMNEFYKSTHLEKKLIENISMLIQDIKPQNELLKNITRCIQEDGRIFPNATPELSKAHQNFAAAKRKIKDSLENILKNNVVKNAIQDSTWMIKDGRYVLPVRTDRKNDVEGIARGVSQTGSTVFIEPKILANDQTALEKSELEIQLEEFKIIKKLSEECIAVNEDIINSIHFLTQLDEIIARSQFANSLDANECLFHNFPDNLKFNFQKARHPLFISEKKPCISNELELFKSNILVLSGPNAGGKTVVLKTVGVFVLMAKCGLFVPSDKAECIEYENIFVLLGDSQNREEDLSTFSGHLEQIKKILHFSNEKTLILLDEGFVGTDPAVGVALARSVLENFAEKKATAIITTHFSSLKTLSSDDPRFFNASMEFESRYLRPTYKILNGIPGQSFALELCQRMGIPSNIIENARNYYGKESQRMENILQDLQEQKAKAQDEFIHQKQLSAQLQQELNKIQQEQKSLIELKDNLVESYKVKLVKRYNAYSHRLEIRERQFAKQKDNLIFELMEENSSHAIQENKTIDEPNLEKSIEKTIQNEIDKVTNTNKKLSSFEQLANIKLNDNSNKKNSNIVNEIQFRQPKQFSQRALLDEAKESLENLNDIFDDIDIELNKNVDHALKKNTNIKVTTQNIQTKVTSKIQNTKEPQYWKPGMRVKVDKFREVGVILKSVDAKGLVECQFGLIKTKVSHFELNVSTNTNKVTNENNTNKKIKSVQLATQNNLNMEISIVMPHAGNTIDLRGQTVDEALHYLELNLDRMLLSNAQYVIIIHGHGFGKVKEGVRQFLKMAHYELDYRPGRHGEGGEGVTVIEFKR